MTLVEDLEKLTNKELDQIVIKGENLHISTSRASTAKRILDSRRQKNIQNKIDTFYKVTYPGFNNFLAISNIASANATLSAVANITESLNNISKTYVDALGGASISALSPLLTNIKDVQQIAGTSVWKEIARNTIDSPILDAIRNIQEINISKLNLSKPAPIIPHKLAEEISSAVSQKADTIFNFPAYTYLFRLERFLRDFINHKIIAPNKANLDSKLPSGMIEDWEGRKKSEEDNIHADHVDYDLIEYSDFPDLKKILEKRTTTSLIRHIINEENLKTITSKLHELEPIRLKIAHSRAVTEKEFKTLEMYAKKIEQILPS